MVGYIAGFVARGLINRVADEECSRALLEDDFLEEPNYLITVKDRGGLVSASKEVVRLCKAAEREYRVAVGAANGVARIPLETLLQRTLRRVDAPFPALPSHDDDGHHALGLARAVTRRYLTIRYHHGNSTCRVVSERQRMVHQMHFQGV